MRVVQHVSNNGILAAPPGVGHELCRPAPITRRIDADGGDLVMTYWRPTEAERKAITEGACIELSLWGRSMPPALVGVDGVPNEGA